MNLTKRKRRIANGALCNEPLNMTPGHGLKLSTNSLYGKLASDPEWSSIPNILTRPQIDPDDMIAYAHVFKKSLTREQLQKLFDIKGNDGILPGFRPRSF